ADGGEKFLVGEANHIKARVQRHRSSNLFESRPLHCERPGIPDGCNQVIEQALIVAWSAPTRILNPVENTGNVIRQGLLEINAYRQNPRFASSFLSVLMGQLNLIPKHFALH